MKIYKLSLLVTIVLFGGCAIDSTRYYIIPTYQSKEQLAKDRYECTKASSHGYNQSISSGNYNANYSYDYGIANANSFGYSGSGITQNKELFDTCMEAKGYRIAREPSERFKAFDLCQIGIDIDLKEGNILNAKRYYQKVCEMSNQGSGCGCHLLGATYYKQKDYINAIKYFKKACDWNYGLACKSLKILQSINQ